MIATCSLGWWWQERWCGALGYGGIWGMADRTWNLAEMILWGGMLRHRTLCMGLGHSADHPLHLAADCQILFIMACWPRTESPLTLKMVAITTVRRTIFVLVVQSLDDPS